MIGSVDLLRKLASGVRPDGAGPLSTPDVIERERFESLLSRVRTGELGSGRPVRLAHGSESEFDREMLSRLADATDAAQAAGAEHLLAWVEGRVLRVDVARREAGEIDGDGGGILTGFDAAVVLTRESTEAARILPAPSAMPSASLAEALARGVRSGAVAEGERAAV